MKNDFDCPRSMKEKKYKRNIWNTFENIMIFPKKKQNVKVKFQGKKEMEILFVVVERYFKYRHWQKRVKIV